jgi:hypothetical protein
MGPFGFGDGTFDSNMIDLPIVVSALSLGVKGSVGTFGDFEDCLALGMWFVALPGDMLFVGLAKVKDDWLWRSDIIGNKPELGLGCFGRLAVEKVTFQNRKFGLWDQCLKFKSRWFKFKPTRFLKRKTRI